MSIPAIKDMSTLLSLALADGDAGKFPRATIYDSGGSLIATVDLSHVAQGLYTSVYTFTAADDFDALFITYKDADHTMESNKHGRALDRFVVSAMATGEDYNEIRQGWALQLTSPPGSRLQGAVHLESNGGLIALPGTSRLAIELKEQDGTSIASQADIAPNAEGFFGPVTFDPFDISSLGVAGTPVIAHATITLSGVGSGTHVGQMEISIADLASS